MSTVTCSNCNSKNTEGSKFCNNCGAALPLSTHITCPNCQIRNPRNLLYCDNCGTRLLPIGELSSEREEEKPVKPESREAPKAFSLPARDPGDELEDQNQLLDWLRTGEEQTEGESDQEDQPSEALVVDDWLNELTKAETEEDESDWFQDVGQSSPDDAAVSELAGWFSVSDDNAGETDLSDWLSELEGESVEESGSETAGILETIPDSLDDLELDDDLTGPSQSDSEEEILADWFSEIQAMSDKESDFPEGDIERPTKPPPSEQDFTNTLVVPPPFPENDDNEELPDWLNEFSGETEGTADSASEGELSGWTGEYDFDEETPTLIQPTLQADDSEEDLPDWLKESAEANGMDTLISSTPPKAEEANDEELPDWLTSFESGVAADTFISAAPQETEAEDEELPDWLGDFDEEEDPTTFISSPSEDAGEDDEELPDWLGSFDSPEDTPTLIAHTPEETEEAEEGLPDWLSSFDSPEDTPTIIAATPEETEAVEDELPDWLSGFDSDEAPETVISDTSEDIDDEDEALPDWLSGFEADDDMATLISTPPTETEEEAGELPDWLSSLDSDDSSEELESEGPEEISSDWFNDLDLEADASTPTETAEPQAEKAAFSDWLYELGSEAAERDSESDAADDEETAIELPAVEPTEEEIITPDWLDGFDDEDDDDDEAADLELLEEEFEGLPDWLDDLEGIDSSEADEIPGGKAAEINEQTDEFDDLIIAGPVLQEETDDSDGFPDWLLDLSNDETAVEPMGEEGSAVFSPVSEQPDWMSDVIPTSDNMEPDSDLETPESEDEELADWLSDLSTANENLDLDDDTDWFEALTLQETWPEIAEDEEIAAQLEESEELTAEPNKPSHEMKGVPKELVSSGLPDWLQEDMPEDFDEEAYVEEEEELLVAGELPDWLQEMKPSDSARSGQRLGSGEGFALTETHDEWQRIFQNMPPGEIDADSEAAELSSAVIPPWLQALKPREVGEEVEEIIESDEPPVTEGPLTGLRGVLPVAPTITEPAAAKTAVQYTISKEQQQQISLLHQLTHEEQAKTKQIVQKKSATFSALWRTILGLLLFAAVLTGVLLPGTNIGLPETTLPVSQSTLDTFNVVDPLVGRSVLVAFEYTPAMAAELDPIALMLLRQLAANDNRILTISQSAAGTAIAEQRVGEVNGLESQSLGLLTGEAVGLRSLGSCLNAANSCNPLFGASDAAAQSDLADLGLIIILTSDRNSLINWVEQVESQTDTPVIAAVAQPIGPLTLPYLSSGQLEGALDGIPNASAYEKRLLGQDGGAFQQFAAQTFAMWLVIIGLIVAGVVYGLAGVARRDEKKGNG